VKPQLVIGSLAAAIVAGLFAAQGASAQAYPLASITLPSPGDTVQLYRGCNNIALTFPDGTASEVVVQAVTPAGVVEAMWRHRADRGGFEGFSPAAPLASDLQTVDFLDPVWLCVAEPSAVSPPPVTPSPSASPIASPSPSDPSAPPPPTPTPSGVTQPSLLPATVGPAQAGGLAEVTLTNDAPFAASIKLDGPESRMIYMPPCSNCVVLVAPPSSCPGQGPQQTFQLLPGIYDVTVHMADPSVWDLTGTWNLAPDTIFSSCFFVVEGLS
jgi:hypothetical protein